MVFSRISPITTASASGSAPPESEVPAPRGTTRTPFAWQYRSTAATCSVLDGSTTASGTCRYALSPSVS